MQLSNPSTSINHKVYRAVLTQSGSSAPVATVLENTLGGTVVWARALAGRYTATLASAFTSNKTFAMAGGPDVVGTSFSSFMVLTSANVITLHTISDGSNADDMLVATPIEILVYP